MLKPFRSLIVAVATIGLTACAHYPDPDYSRLNMSDPVQATIVGSYVKTSWPLGYEVTWVQATENRTMSSYEKSLGTAFPLQPGSRTISVAFTQAALHGKTSFSVEVKPGARLIAKSSKKNDVLVSMWIEDQVTGQIVAGKEFVTITNTDALHIPVYIER